LPSGRRALLSDTVGFIRALPKGLLNAFRATLEEVQEAALIVHVSDVSSAHNQELDEAVKKILAELGVAGRPTLHVWNKMDLLPADERSELEKSISHPPEGTEPPVLVSALTGEGLEGLLRRMDQALPGDPVERLSLRLPLSEGRTLAMVHALGHVYHSELADSHMLLDAEISVSVARRLKLQHFSVNGTF
jgi:GTP-binding protein HflX